MKRKKCIVSFEKIDPPMGHNQGMNAEAFSDVSAIQSISKYPLITWPQSRKSNIAGDKKHTTHSHNDIVLQSAKNQLIGARALFPTVSGNQVQCLRARASACLRAFEKLEELEDLCESAAEK